VTGPAALSGERGGWIVDAVILAAWLIAIGAVMRYDHGAFGWMPGVPPLAVAPAEAQEQWFGLYYQGEKVGFTHLILAPDEQDGVPGFLLMDDGRVRLELLGSAQQLRISAKSFVDSDWRLRRMSASLETDGYRLTLSGERQGDELLLTITTPASAKQQRLHDPSGRIWMSGLSSWAAFHKLKIGQRGQLWLLNPLAMKPEPANFHVTGLERFGDQDAMVIETEYQGMKSTTWLGRSGRVLKESSPMGWVMLQESRERAMGWARGQAPVDLMAATAVPVDRPIEHPERLTRLVFLVEGVAPDAIRIDRQPWQVISPADTADGIEPPPEPRFVVSLARPDLASPQRSSAPSPTHTSATAFVQSDDKEVMEKAREIVGDASQRWQQAVALHDWVFRTLTKRLSIGLPTTKDVLVSLAGDCHEHTIVFTGLARSLGIPTRMVAGLFYLHGRFYYHAWPEVWLPLDEASSEQAPQDGRWIPMDPTTGQVLADVTHIGLVEAEDEALIALGQFVGRIRLRILEMDELQ
jgi:hypothetical protein